MSNVEVVFFAADPHSAPRAGGHGERPRLLIDEEVRQIREKVRQAEHRDRLSLNTHWATRTDDLLQLLNERTPQVVHFSGHGGRGGITVVGADPAHQQRVDADALADFFRVFRGDIRLVVLNACWSMDQARTISQVVGCAIGTPDAISDDAAITFSASFYRAIAFGKSVQVAFDQARAALKLDHFDELRYPQLLHRDDVDPAELYLIQPLQAPPVAPEIAEPPAPPVARGRRAAVVAAVIAMASAGGTMIYDAVREDLPRPQGVAATAGAPSALNPGAALDAGLDLQRAGRDSAALPYFERAANAGNAEAMAYLGMAYLDGKGTEPQHVLAAQWLRKSKDEGNARGMNGLAIAHRRGDGVDQSRRWARFYFLKAANLGFADAMRNLAILYREEFVADSGYVRVVEWYQKAAAAGSLDALVDLGGLHEAGEGVARDSAQAFRLYERAAQGGLTRAMVVVGKRHQDRGQHAQALYWYRRGADAGDPDALNNLGVMHQNGLGLPVDLVQARELYRRAVAAGSEVAQANLEALGGG